jgi:uncharacterized protein (DUF1330 family)
MPYYFIAFIRIQDHPEYKKYLDRAREVFSRYNGTYLAVDDSPEVVEGTWDYTRAVLIRFETRGDYENWYNSDDYQLILAYRLKAAHCDTILVQGREQD